MQNFSKNVKYFKKGGTPEHVRDLYLSRIVEECKNMQILF